MTMQSLSLDLTFLGITFDPKKKYSYTWPGQKAAIVSGEELQAVCAGADPRQLDIREMAPVFKTEAQRTEEKP